MVEHLRLTHLSNGGLVTTGGSGCRSGSSRRGSACEKLCFAHMSLMAESLMGLRLDEGTIAAAAAAAMALLVAAGVGTAGMRRRRVLGEMGLQEPTVQWSHGLQAFHRHPGSFARPLPCDWKSTGRSPFRNWLCG